MGRTPKEKIQGWKFQKVHVPRSCFGAVAWFFFHPWEEPIRKQHINWHWLGSRDDAVVRPLASNHCVPDLIPGSGVMWVDFGFLLCSKRVFSGYSNFPLSSKTSISKLHFDPGMHSYFWRRSCELLGVPWVHVNKIILYYITSLVSTQYPSLGDIITVSYILHWAVWVCALVSIICCKLWSHSGKTLYSHCLSPSRHVQIHW